MKDFWDKTGKIYDPFGVFDFDGDGEHDFAETMTAVDYFDEDTPTRTPTNTAEAAMSTPRMRVGRALPRREGRESAMGAIRSRKGSGCCGISAPLPARRRRSVGASSLRSSTISI